MRKLPTPSTPLRLLRWRRTPHPLFSHFLAIDEHHLPPLLRHQSPPRRTLAQVRLEPFGELWFTSYVPHRSPADDVLNPQSSSPTGAPNNDHKPPDERTIKLGKTLRILSPLLPDILKSPLPQSILSPNVTLHLFPSTHPHLPTVKGRVPYRAALWTAPMAWGCVPLVGNTKLQIISEKIVRTGFVTSPPTTAANDLGDEKLVVRWKTEKRKNGGGHTSQNQTGQSPSTTSTSSSAGSNRTNRTLSSLLGGDRPLFTPTTQTSSTSEFTGLFIFTFDAHGRIASHTIEHADENNGFDKTSKVVTLTDWLLGKVGGRGAKEEDLVGVPGLAAVGGRNECRFFRERAEKDGGR